MKLYRKTLLSILCIAAVPLSVLVAGVDPALGEARYRNPELPQEVIVSDTLDLLTLNVAHGRGTALNQLLVSGDQHRKNLTAIAATLLASDVQVAALQEADAPSFWSGKFDHVAFLGDATDYRFSVHG